MDLQNIENRLRRGRANTTQLNLQNLQDYFQRNNIKLMMKRTRKPNTNIDLSQYESYDYNIWGLDKSEEEKATEQDALAQLKRATENKPKVTFTGLNLNPKFGEMLLDEKVVPCRLVRQLHLGEPRVQKKKSKYPLTWKSFREMIERLPKIEPTISNRAHKKSRRYTKTPIDTRWVKDTVMDPDLAQFMDRRPCEAISFSFEPKGRSKAKKQLDLKFHNKLVDFDEYVGLSDWSTFYGRNLRPENFQYSKMYSGLGQLMVNTTNNIMGLKLGLHWRNLNNFRLYQNDQDQQIEDFACNSALNSSHRASHLVIKHTNQDMLYLFDCNEQMYLQKIRLERGTKNILQSEFTHRQSAFGKACPDRDGRALAELEKRHTMIQRHKVPKNLAISELNSQASNESYMKRGLLLTDVERTVAAGSSVVQCLEYHDNLIYYLDNSFRFLMFDNRLNQSVVVKQLRDCEQRYGRRLTPESLFAHAQDKMVCVSAPDKGVLLYDIRNSKRPIKDTFDYTQTRAEASECEFKSESLGEHKRGLTRRLPTGAVSQLLDKAHAPDDFALFGQRARKGSGKQSGSARHSPERRLQGEFAPEMPDFRIGELDFAGARAAESLRVPQQELQAQEHDRVSGDHFGPGEGRQGSRVSAGVQHEGELCVQPEYE